MFQMFTSKHAPNVHFQTCSWGVFSKLQSSAIPKIRVFHLSCGYASPASNLYYYVYILSQPMDPEKKSLNFIFPTKYVIPKSLKFSHWLSKTMFTSFFWPKVQGKRTYHKDIEDEEKD